MTIRILDDTERADVTKLAMHELAALRFDPKHAEHTLLAELKKAHAAHSPGTLPPPEAMLATFIEQVLNFQQDPKDQYGSKYMLDARRDLKVDLATLRVARGKDASKLVDDIEKVAVDKLAPYVQGYVRPVLEQAAGVGYAPASSVHRFP